MAFELGYGRVVHSDVAEKRAARIDRRGWKRLNRRDRSVQADSIDRDRQGEQPERYVSRGRRMKVDRRTDAFMNGLIKTIAGVVVGKRSVRQMRWMGDSPPPHASRIRRTRRNADATIERTPFGRMGTTESQRTWS